MQILLSQVKDIYLFGLLLERKTKTMNYGIDNNSIYLQTGQGLKVKTWFELDWSGAGIYLWILNWKGWWIWTNNKYYEQ